MLHARRTPKATHFLLLCALLSTSCAQTASQDCLSLEVVLVDPADAGWMQSDTTTLTFEIVSPQPPETLEVWVDGGGTDGWQSVSVQDSQFSIDTQPLSPNTDYTIKARACGATTTTVVSTLPPPVGALTGKTYLADVLSDGVVWHKPKDPDRSIQVAAFQNNHNLLLHVLEHDAANQTLHLLATQGYTDFDEVLQEPCLTPTSLQPHHFVNNPGFRTDPQDLVTDEEDATTVMPDSVMQGVFIDGGSAIQSFRLTTHIDLRPLLDGSPDKVCTLLGPCQECPDQENGDSPACLPLDVEVPMAPTWDGTFQPEHIAEGDC